MTAMASRTSPGRAHRALAGTPGGVDVTIKARDGYPLAATLYTSSDEEPRRAALIAPAMGARRHAYRDYAVHLAREGWAVVALDYRGIGGSRRGSVRHSPASLREWGQYDIAGAIDWLERQFHPVRMVAIGHSIGGQLMALAPNHRRLDALLAVAAQKGYWRLWDPRWRYVLCGLWHLLPVLVRLFGCLPLQPAGCEPLPRRVALDWGRWGRHPDFVDDDGRSLHEHYARFTAPILALSFADDAFLAPRRAVQRMLEIYVNAPVTHRHIVPRDLGLPALGHSGFFRDGVAPALWRETSAWLQSV